MKKIITLCCFIASMQTAFAQDIDSLLQKIATEKDETGRVELILQIFAATQETNPALDMQNAQKLLQHSQKNKDRV